MNKSFLVSAHGQIFGVYEATSEQQAKDLCAADAGYKDEKNMESVLAAASVRAGHCH